MKWKTYWIGAMSKFHKVFGEKTTEDYEQLPPVIDYNIEESEFLPQLKYTRNDLVEEQITALQYEVDLLKVVINELCNDIKYYESYKITLNNWGLKDGESRTDIVKKFLGQSKPL